MTVMVTTTIQGCSGTVTMPSGSTILDLLNERGLFVDAHVVLRDGRPVPETETIEDGWTLELVRVGSSG